MPVHSLLDERFENIFQSPFHCMIINVQIRNLNCNGVGQNTIFPIFPGNCPALFVTN